MIPKMQVNRLTEERKPMSDDMKIGLMIIGTILGVAAMISGPLYLTAARDSDRRYRLEMKRMEQSDPARYLCRPENPNTESE